MTDLTQQQQQAIAEIVARESGDADATASVSSRLADISDFKGPFCECWPCARKILELLAKVLPAGTLRDAVAKLIAIGDQIFKLLCPVIG